MTNIELINELNTLLKDLNVRHDELQTKMRELGSAAVEVNLLRSRIDDLILKAKAQ